MVYLFQNSSFCDILHILWNNRTFNIHCIMLTLQQKQKDNINYLIA